MPRGCGQRAVARCARPRPARTPRSFTYRDEDAMPHPEWGLLIVVYLFLGGLGAGALVLSALANFAGRQRDYQGIARAGALAAPLPVLLGTGLLVFDLGRPVFFWK